MRRRIVSLLLTVAMLVSVLSIGTIGVSAGNSSVDATITTPNSTISGVTVSGGGGNFTLTFKVADAVTDATTLIVASAYIGELDVAGVGDDPAGVANDSVGAFYGGTKSATGDAGSKTVEFTVTIPENAAESGKDYGYGGDEGVNYTIYATTSANSATNMVATFKLDASGDIQIPFEVTAATESGSGTVGTAITAVDLTDNVKGGSGTYTYSDGTNALNDTGLTLTNGKISGTPTKAGTITVPVTVSDGANSDTVTVTLTIAKGTAVASLSAASATYTGSEQKPTVAVKVGSLTLAENTNFTVAWNPATVTNAGDYTATVTLGSTANYDFAAGGNTLTYTINKANRTAPVVTVTNASAADATDGKITITSPIAGATYEISTDGTTYTDATVTGGEITGLAAGTYSIRVKADGNYNASPAAPAAVKAPGVPVADITDLAKTYTGKPQGATVKVTVEDATGAEQVVDPADYTVSYTGTDGTTYAKSETAPTDAGKYTVTVEMKSPARPAGTATLVIAQAKPGEPELLDEIIVDETTLGDVMKNGALKLPGVNNDEVAGTFTWVGDVDDDTMIVPGTKYQWKFETTNPNYQGLVGEIAWELEDEPRHEAIMLGRKDTTLFAPDDNLNRAEAATILSRLYGMYTDEEIFDETKGAAVQHAPTGFTDVNDSAIWYYAAVGFAQNKNLIEGKSATSFAPAAKITRAEFVTMLARLVANAKDVPEVDVSQSKLTGISGHWAENAIVYLELNKGGLNGKVGTDFKPNDNLTRAEAAKMVNAVFGRVQSTSIKEEDQLDADLNLFTDVYRNTWYYNNVIEATVGHDAADPDFRHVK